MKPLTDKKIAVFVANLYDDREFWYSAIRLKEAGATVTVVGEKKGEKYKSKFDMPAEAEASFAEIKAEDFDGVVIPGGFAPDYMRRSKEGVAFVKKMDEQGKMIAFICHAGWVPISAGIIKGRKVTSVGSIKDDLVNAGGEWVDQSVVVDKNFITSRNPDDLPDFMTGVIKFFSGKAQN